MTGRAGRSMFRPVPEPHLFSYKPDGETLRQFLLSTARVRLIRGPWNSGKSSAGCVGCLMMMQAQAPDKNGVRRTRGAVVRNTGPELKTTTIKTWLEWFPEAVFGKFAWSPPLTHNIRLGPLPDGTRIECEVLFLALDDASDVKRLFSLELSWAWVNEARFVPKDAFDGLVGRVDRFPRKIDGGCTRPGVIADTNAPPEDHWWPIVAGDKPAPEYWSDADKLTMLKPADWKFFAQPPAMVEKFDAKGVLTGYEVNRGQVPGIPAGENLAFMSADYYFNTIQGKKRSWIEVNILNRYGASFDGKACYPSFRAEVHVASEELAPLPDLPVYVGIDFGRTPAAVFGQRIGLRWQILFELITRDMSVREFARLLRAFMADHFKPGTSFRVYGDPSGDVMAQTRDETPFDLLRAAAIVAFPAPSNDLVLRIEAVEEVLNRMQDGVPSFLLSPKCIVLKAAMEGGYHYRRLQVGQQEMYAQEPSKNRYSHPAEGLQYMLLGAGEGTALLTGPSARSRPPATRMKRDFHVFERRQRSVRGW